MEKVKGRKKIVDVMLDVLAWLSFFVAVTLAVSVFFSTFSGTENGKTLFGHKLLIVNGDSMSRSEISQDEKIYFGIGDLIVIKEVKDPSDIEVGNVITFVSSSPESLGETVSHKVRSVKTGNGGRLIGFETYGINTGVSDGAIAEPSNIIGKYVLKIPYLGAMFGFFKKPAGFFTSILIPCLLLLIFFSIKVGKQIAKKEMADIMNTEIESLKDRMSRIEGTEITVGESDKTMAEPEKIVGQDNTGATERALEAALNTINSTVETLARTVESLAQMAGKPVETLAHTVETLTEAVVKKEVAEEVTASEEIVEECPELEEAEDPEDVPFSRGLFALDGEVKNYFSDIHNELVSYKKIKYHISDKGISYRLGKSTVARMAVYGDTLKLCLAMNLRGRRKTEFMRENSDGIKLYRDLLFTVAVKTENSRDNAIRLVHYLAKTNHLTRNVRFKKENIFRQIKLFK